MLYEFNKNETGNILLVYRMTLHPDVKVPK